MRFTEDKLPDGFQILVRLSGNLMEPNTPFPKPSPAPGVTYLIDTRELTAINSIGIRAFMNWMRDLGARPMTFTNCPKFFIDQVNMVADFLPRHARIQSFFVPYYSEATETDRMVLYRAGTEFTNEGGSVTLQHPANVVDPAGNPMEIDVLGDRFFKFLEKYS